MSVISMGIVFSVVTACIYRVNADNACFHRVLIVCFHYSNSIYCNSFPQCNQWLL